MIDFKRPLSVVVCAAFVSSALFAADVAPSFVHVIWNKKSFELTPLSGSATTESDTLTTDAYRVAMKNRVLTYGSKSVSLEAGALVVRGLNLKMKIAEINATAFTVIDIPEVKVVGFKIETKTRRETKEIGLPTLSDQEFQLNEIESLSIALPARLDLISTTLDGKTQWRIGNSQEFEASMRTSLEKAITPELLKNATRPSLNGVPDVAKGPLSNILSSLHDSLIPSLRTALINWALSEAVSEKLVLSVAKALPLHTLPEGELHWSLQPEENGMISLALGQDMVMPKVTNLVTNLQDEVMVVANERGLGLLARCSARLLENSEAQDPAALRVLRSKETTVKFESQNNERWLTVSAQLARGQDTRAVEAAFQLTNDGRVELRALFAAQTETTERTLWNKWFQAAQGGLESTVLKTLLSEELAKSQSGEQRARLAFTEGSVPGAIYGKETLLVVRYK